MRIRWYLALILIFAAIGETVHAQSFQGGIRGTVKDAGGVLSYAVVMLVNEQTEVTHQTTPAREART